MKKEPTYTADFTQSREEHQHIFTSPSHGCVNLLYVYLWVSLVCPTLCESQPIPKICGANNFCNTVWIHQPDKTPKNQRNHIESCIYIYITSYIKHIEFISNPCAYHWFRTPNPPTRQGSQVIRSISTARPLPRSPRPPGLLEGQAWKIITWRPGAPREELQNLRHGGTALVVYNAIHYPLVN